MSPPCSTCALSLRWCYCECPFFQLYDQENEVVAEAIDVLQEACEDEVSFFVVLYKKLYQTPGDLFIFGSLKGGLKR